MLTLALKLLLQITDGYYIIFSRYYFRVRQGHHFRVCVYMNSNVITLCRTPMINFIGITTTRPSLVHSRKTGNTGPTLFY